MLIKLRKLFLVIFFLVLGYSFETVGFTVIRFQAKIYLSLVNNVLFIKKRQCSNDRS